jgi:hypothetical protein
MYTIRRFCNDANGVKYWKNDNVSYETYDKALIVCFEQSLREAQYLMRESNYENWVEVERDLAVTEGYLTGGIEEELYYLPIATVHYDHAPWDRENDCEITVITGYDIVECE